MAKKNTSLAARSPVFALLSWWLQPSSLLCAALTLGCVASAVGITVVAHEMRTTIAQHHKSTVEKNELMEMRNRLWLEHGSRYSFAEVERAARGIGMVRPPVFASDAQAATDGSSIVNGSLLAVQDRRP